MSGADASAPPWRLDTVPNDGSAPRVFGPAFGTSQTGAPLVDFVGNCTSNASGFVVYGAMVRLLCYFVHRYISCTHFMRILLTL